MRNKRSTSKAVWAAAIITAFAALSLASSASAKLVGEFTRFEQCPYTNTEVKKCIYSLNEGGEVVLGSKKVPIINPVTIQGGFGKAVEGVSPFFAATNGVTLSKTPQPVPGGLAGIVNCKEISEPFLRFACELTFENGLTGLNSTLELAQPASNIKISELNLTLAEGVALKLPVKAHLENPFLGSNCYVGSSGSPLTWELTAGTTAPPKPNEPITGATGEAEFLEGGRILKLNDNVLVDNAWSAPGASGCGGFLVELVLDPIINVASGLPSAAGHNSALLKNTIYTATSTAVKKNNEEHP